MMTPIKDNVAEDVVWAIQEGIARSYSELHAQLRVYPAARIVAAANALCDSGALRVGEGGFEVPSAAERLGDTNLPASSEPGSEMVAAAESRAEITGIDEEPARNRQLRSAAVDARAEETAEAKIDEPHQGEPPLAAAVVSAAHDQLEERDAAVSEPESLDQSAEAASADSAFDEDSAPTLLEESVGSIMTLTPITFLDLPDHLLRDLHARGIHAVYELVQRLGSLGGQIGKDRLAFLLKRLSELAGEPPVALSTDDKHQLSLLSGSNLAYFDWFGVLCMNISSDLTESEIRERLEDETFSIGFDEPFSFAGFSKIYQQGSLVANQKLYEHFCRHGYPVNGDAFHVIMLPTVEEMLDYGAYETPSELAHSFLKEFTERKTTENACFGMLRDKFLALKERCDGLGSSERIGIGSDLCFSRAAERLAELEPSCLFDEENLTLQCRATRD